MSLPPYLQQFLQTGVLPPGNNKIHQPHPQSSDQGHDANEFVPIGPNDVPTDSQGAFQHFKGDQSASSTSQNSFLLSQSQPAGRPPQDLQQLLAAPSHEEVDRPNLTDNMTSNLNNDPNQAKENAAANLPILQAFLRSETGGVMNVQQPPSPPQQMICNPYLSWTPNSDSCQPQTQVAPTTSGLHQLVDNVRSQTPTSKGMPTNRISAVHIRDMSNAADRRQTNPTLPEIVSQSSMPRSPTMGTAQADFPSESENEKPEQQPCEFDQYSNASLSPSISSNSSKSGSEDDYATVKICFHSISESNPFDDVQRSNSQGQIGSYGATSPVPAPVKPISTQRSQSSSAYDTRVPMASLQSVAKRAVDESPFDSVSFQHAAHSDNNEITSNSSNLEERSISPPSMTLRPTRYSEYHRRSLSQIPSTAYSKAIPPSKFKQCSRPAALTLRPQSPNPRGLPLPPSPRPGTSLPPSPLPQTPSSSQTYLRPPQPSPTVPPIPAEDRSRVKSDVRTRSRSRPAADNDKLTLHDHLTLKPRHEIGINSFSDVADLASLSIQTQIHDPHAAYPRNRNSQKKRRTILGQDDLDAYPSSDQSDDDILSAYMD